MLTSSIHSALSGPRVRASLWLLLTVCAGCGPALQTANPVDPDRARETLHSILESWQRGETPESWKQRSPEVVVQDRDWSMGATLKEFTIIGRGEARDANLYCPVKLVLDERQGGPQQRTVTYVVGTDPVLTVFRDVMQ